MFPTIKASLVAVTTAGLVAIGQTAMTADLSYVTSFGTSGSGTGQFSFPPGVAVDSSGNVYVADSSNDRVDRFNFKGFMSSARGHSSRANKALI